MMANIISGIIPVIVITVTAIIIKGITIYDLSTYWRSGWQ
jgi:hypothetical protein